MTLKLFSYTVDFGIQNRVFISNSSLKTIATPAFEGALVIQKTDQLFAYFQPENGLKTSHIQIVREVVRSKKTCKSTSYQGYQTFGFTFDNK